MFHPVTLKNKVIENKWLEKDFKIKDRHIKFKDKRFIDDNIEHRSQIYQENGKEIRIETARKYFNPVEIRDYLSVAGFNEIEFSLTYDEKGFTKQINEEDIQTNYIVKAKK